MTQGSLFAVEDVATTPHQTPLDANGVEQVFFGEQRKARRDPADNLDLDDVAPEIIGGGAEGLSPLDLGGVKIARAESAALHVLAREVPLPLQRAEMIVHSVRGANPHPRPDLSERRRVAAVGDGLPNEVENHLLSFG